MAEQEKAEQKGTSRGWCFTWNNPSHKVLFPDGLPEQIKYIVYQLEKGEKGTQHIQGYIYFNKPVRFSAVKKLTFKTTEGEEVKAFQQAHIEKARGTAEQNKAYCTKAEGRLEGPWEIGNIPKQGARTDLHEAAEELMRSGDIRAIDSAVFLKYASGCLKLAALAPPPRRDNLKVITLIGPTGIGKSYAVHDMYPDIYIANMGNSGLWWDGYTGQKVIMFEEFKGQVQLQKMLQILDPYPLRLEIKGGLVPARYTLVFITSNYTPDQWYKNDFGNRDAEIAALARRLDAGDPTRIPPKPDGVRFIKADTREELHRKLDLAMQIKDLEPKPEPKKATEAAIDELAEAAAAIPSPAKTPELSDEEKQPKLKRCRTQIIEEEAMIIDDETPAQAPHP